MSARRNSRRILGSLLFRFKSFISVEVVCGPQENHLFVGVTHFETPDEQEVSEH
jgi:hypothetical protein